MSVLMLSHVNSTEKLKLIQTKTEKEFQFMALLLKQIQKVS